MTFSATSLSARDRRALLIGAMALLVYVAVVGARSYGTAVGDARRHLDAQRELLARELGMLEAERRIDGRLQEVAVSFASRSEAMFSAADSLAAVSDLSAFLLDAARQNRVHVEHVEGRSSSVQTEGAVTLMVMLRGRSDLEGLADFTTALGEAANLIRIEQFSITRMPSPERGDPADTAASPDVQVLEFSALVTGYALPEDGDGREEDE